MALLITNPRQDGSIELGGGVKSFGNLFKLWCKITAFALLSCDVSLSIGCFLIPDINV